jgi:hypothetical protein
MYVLVLIWCAGAVGHTCNPIMMPQYYSKDDCSLVGTRSIQDEPGIRRFFCLRKDKEVPLPKPRPSIGDR